MKLTSKFKENEVFERTLRNAYSEEICDIVIEWIEEALAYVFNKISNDDTFALGRVNRDDKTIEYTGEELTLEEIIHSVMDEMEIALDGTESRETIEEELRVLSEAL